MNDFSDDYLVFLTTATLCLAYPKHIDQIESDVVFHQWNTLKNAFATTDRARALCDECAKRSDRGPSCLNDEASPATQEFFSHLYDEDAETFPPSTHEKIAFAILVASYQYANK